MHYIRLLPSMIHIYIVPLQRVSEVNHTTQIIVQSLAQKNQLGYLVSHSGRGVRLCPSLAIPADQDVFNEICHPLPQNTIVRGWQIRPSRCD
jgi:hypothetical protein